MKENTDLALKCSGGVISDVIFASFGLVTGDCVDGLKADPTCNAAKSVDIVKAACVGKSSCTLKATDDVFGDPCYGKPKQLGASIKCSGGGKAAFEMTVTVPVNSSGHSRMAVLPTASTSITEGTTTFYSNGKMMANVEGIYDVTKDDSGYLWVHHGSGRYSFSFTV